MSKIQIGKYKLSVLLVTYNHERYIEKALQSILDQHLNEDVELVEIVVADDASSDRTLDLIRSYEGKTSRFVFNYLARQPNLGITKNYQRGFAACAGEYVAVLEGDDYWSSPDKLAKQMDVLAQDQGCMLCAANYLVLNEVDANEHLRIANTSGQQIITVPNLIADNIIGNFSTCMYRKEALCRIPTRTYELKSYDWIINICVGTHGHIIFLNEPLSVYRIHGKGVWSSLEVTSKLQSQIEVLPSYDALTCGIYSEHFSALSARLKHELFVVQHGTPATQKRKGPLSRFWKKTKTRLKGALQ